MVLEVTGVRDPVDRIVPVTGDDRSVEGGWSSRVGVVFEVAFLEVVSVEDDVRRGVWCDFRRADRADPRSDRSRARQVEVLDVGVEGIDAPRRIAGVNSADEADEEVDAADGQHDGSRELTSQ